MELEEAFKKVIGGGMLVDHRCAICDGPVGYISNNEQIGFDGSCGCSSYQSEPQVVKLSEFIEFALKTRMEKTDG